VPSPDPDVPWNLDETGEPPAQFIAPGQQLVLHRVDPLRAIAVPAGSIQDATSVSEIQAAVAMVRGAAA